MIEKNQITGLILAGGRATRMGGVDKGLQNYRGSPMAMHVLLRLAPQVGEVMINANRNLGAYESMGAAVWPDTLPDFAGPLAGFIAGLEHCDTPYMMTVPCDTPVFPENLVQTLAQALAIQDADIAMVATPGGNGMRTQPVFCLLKTSLLPSLLTFTGQGQRKIDKWTALHRCVEVPFDDARAFAGANTLAELQAIQDPNHG